MNTKGLQELITQETSIERWYSTRLQSTMTNESTIVDGIGESVTYSEEINHQRSSSPESSANIIPIGGTEPTNNAVGSLNTTEDQSSPTSCTTHSPAPGDSNYLNDEVESQADTNMISYS